MSKFHYTLALHDALDICEKLRASDREEIDACTAPMTDAERANQLVAGPGMKFTVWATDGAPVVMGGWMPLWPGVVSSWMLATDRILEVGAALDHAALRGHQMLFEEGVHRCQAFGLATHESARNWLLLLGYRPEGVHHQFGRTGETFISYAKLKRVAA